MKVRVQNVIMYGACVCLRERKYHQTRHMSVHTEHTHCVGCLVCAPQTSVSTHVDADTVHTQTRAGMRVRRIVAHALERALAMCSHVYALRNRMRMFGRVKFNTFCGDSEQIADRERALETITITT